MKMLWRRKLGVSSILLETKLAEQHFKSEEIY